MPQSENIGELNVSVGADYSDLQSALSGAEAAATAGGQQIGTALTAGFERAGDEVSAFAGLFADIPWDQTKTAFADLGSSAEAAAAQVSAAASSSGTALTEAMQAAQQPIAEVSQQLNLFGEAIDGIPWADATGQLNLFTDEIEPLTAGIVAAAGAEETLAGNTAAVGSAMGAATPEVEQAGASMADLAKELIAVSAAMVLVNKITDLGTAALQASDDITRAQISLTVLTGSAQTATSDIAQLESLGQSDGLAMPALLEAAARMQSLLGPSANVVGILAQLANSAAVSGQNIETAAQAFDRMASSGTAAARSLLPLGINMQDLAAAFNTLSGTALATDQNVNTLFKSLSETERIEVLQQALTKLNGIAQQVKDETFGGQWAALVAQWSQVLANAGQALLPVIDDILDLTKTEIVPFIQGVIDIFTALPGPLKDGAIGLGLVSVAAIGLAASLGTLGIALGGLQKLASTLGISSLGTQAATAATEVAEAGTAIEGVGTVATVSAAALAGWVAVIGALVVEVGILGKSFYDYIAATNGAKDAQTQLAANAATLYADLQKHVAGNQQLTDTLTNLKQSYDDGAISLEAYAKGLQGIVSQATGATFSITATGKAIDLTSDNIANLNKTLTTNNQAFSTAVDAYNRLNAALGQGQATQEQVVAALQAVNEAFGKLPGVMEPVSLALANQATSALTAKQGYQTAQGVFEALLAAYNRGAPVLGLLTAAQDTLTKAEQAAATAGAPIPGTIQAVTMAAEGAINGLSSLASAQDIQAASAKAQGTSLTLLTQDVIVAGQKLVLLTAAQADAQKAADNGTGSAKQLQVAEQAVVAASTDLAAKQRALADAHLAAGNQAAIAGGEVGILKGELDAANLTMQQAKDKADAGAGSLSSYASAQKAVTTAAINLAEGVGEAASGMKGIVDSTDMAGTAAAGAQAKLVALTQAYKDNKASVSDLASAQNAALNAKIAFDQQLAIEQTGLSTATTNTALLATQVAAAQAKYDDLKTAVEQGLPVQDQLIQAESDLKSKQDALNTALSNSVSPLAAAADGVNTLKTDAQSAISVMGELADKMGTVGAQAKAMAVSVASAINDVDAAIDSIAGKLPAGSSGSGRVNETGFGSFGQPIYSVTASIPPETIFQQAMQAALAAADQQANPNNSANPLTVAQEALAEATATLKVDQTYFGQTSSTGGQLVSVSALQSAQAAVATAQKAIDSLTGGGSTSAPSSTGSVVLAPGESLTGITVQSAIAALNAANQSLSTIKYEYENGIGNISQQDYQQALAVVAAAQSAYNNLAASGATASTGSGTASSAPTTGPTDTSAYGGSYPGVVAHQAPGEVWVVDTSGAAPGGGTGTAAGGVSSDAAVALAASSTADTVSTAADTMANVTQALTALSGQLIDLTGGAAPANTATYPASQISSGVVNATGYFTINGIVYYLVNGQPANGTYNGLVFVNGIAVGVQDTGTSTPSGISSGNLPSGGSFSNGSNPSGDTAANTVAAYQAAVAAAAAAGVPYDGSVPWDGKDPRKAANAVAASASVPLASAPVGGGGGLSTQAVTVNIDMRGALVSNPTQLKAMLTSSVQQQLVQNLFNKGARMNQ